jgi:hypothetical protein
VLSQDREQRIRRVLLRIREEIDHRLRAVPVRNRHEAVGKTTIGF